MVSRNDADFKKAIEKVIGKKIPRVVWELTIDFLLLAPSHENFDKYDVEDTVPIIRRMLNLYRRKHPST